MVSFEAEAFSFFSRRLLILSEDGVGPGCAFKQMVILHARASLKQIAGNFGVIFG
jgi:hypothetical protein